MKFFRSSRGTIEGKKVGIFIDAANLYHSAKHLYGKNVNFSALISAANRFGTVVVTNIYVVRSEEGKEANFFLALQKSGYTIREKDLQVYAGGAKKGDWDVGIAIDCVKAADTVDVLILGSGDGDFVPLVEYLREHRGKTVIGAAFARSSSSRLKEAVNDFIDLGREQRRYLLGNRRPKKEGNVESTSSEEH